MDRLQNIQHTFRLEIEQINEEIKKALASDSSLLNSVVAYYLQSKGKQVRPLLVLLAATIVGKVNSLAIHGAVSIELLHNASLIHDDVVDESPIRRGRATVNNVWDNKVAVLVGDFFVSSALDSLVETGNVAIVAEIAKLGKELAKGEINQLSNLQSHSTDEEHYFEVIEQKTASLFVSCLRVGALAANATTQELTALTEIGRKLGLCFQIKDDLFDYGVGVESLGKPIGTDLYEGKLTLPLIYAANNADWCNRDSLLALITKEGEYTQTDIETLVAYAHESGGIAYTEQRMQQLQQEAIELLKPFEHRPHIALLQELISYTVERKR